MTSSAESRAPRAPVQGVGGDLPPTRGPLAGEHRAPDLRRLTEADTDSYRALRLRALQESPAAFGQTYEEGLAQPLAITAERLRAQATGDSFTLGAFAAGELIGTVTVVREERSKRRHIAAVVAVYVAPEARGRGLGRALLTAAIARARRIEGLEQLQLSVVTSNAAARHLYRALGFVAYGLERRAFRRGEVYDDEELMALDLLAAEGAAG